MTQLFQALAARVDGWREAGYPCNTYPALREVLKFATDEQMAGQLRFHARRRQ